MLIRLALLLSILLIGASAALFLITGEPRYTRFAWQVARFMIYTMLVFAALYLIERFGVVAWRVLI